SRCGSRRNHWRISPSRGRGGQTCQSAFASTHRCYPQHPSSPKRSHDFQWETPGNCAGIYHRFLVNGATTLRTSLTRNGIKYWVFYPNRTPVGSNVWAGHRRQGPQPAYYWPTPLHPGYHLNHHCCRRRLDRNCHHALTPISPSTQAPTPPPHISVVTAWAITPGIPAWALLVLNSFSFRGALNVVSSCVCAYIVWVMYKTTGTLSKDVRSPHTSVGHYLREQFPNANVRPLQKEYKSLANDLVVDSMGANPGNVGTAVDVIVKLTLNPDETPRSALMRFLLDLDYREVVNELANIVGHSDDSELVSRAAWGLAL